MCAHIDDTTRLFQLAGHFSKDFFSMTDITRVLMRQPQKLPVMPKLIYKSDYLLLRSYSHGHAIKENSIYSNKAGKASKHLNVLGQICTIMRLLWTRENNL